MTAFAPAASGRSDSLSALQANDPELLRAALSRGDITASHLGTLRVSICLQSISLCPPRCRKELPAIETFSSAARSSSKISAAPLAAAHSFFFQATVR
jgi:hypothetical protein